MRFHEFFKSTFLFLFYFHFQSTNGVYVNGIKIPPDTNAKINHCDRIRLDPEGNYDWRFEIHKEIPVVEEPSQQM